jgi:NTE family protein
MNRYRAPSLLALTALLFLGGCATRPVNPPITHVDPDKGYRYSTREKHLPQNETIAILTFSGGGTRAAAFSYGVLEVLRRTEAITRTGEKVRLLDGIDIITGVSGGSFTALAYGLYGEKLFDIYEQAFLKRNVQGELIGRVLNPGNWGALWSPTFGRSEEAAQLYDEILFHGATYADLDRGNGPLILVQATDISTGSRVGFNQAFFDFICSDLDPMPLSRAAAASSAVPIALSPVTINNYSGTCHYNGPGWLRLITDPANPARPAARSIRRVHELESYADSAERPYIHLVDGGLSDNLGMRAVLEAMEELEALRSLGQSTPLDHIRRIVVITVNSLSSPETNWDKSEASPGDISLLVKATGVPIDRYSYESVEQLRDIIARWKLLRSVSNSPAFTGSRDPGLAQSIAVPTIDLYAINVSFPDLKDKAEFEYLNNLPTSFVLPPEAVDRLRAAAGKILLESPDFQRLAKDLGATVIPDPR